MCHQLFPFFRNIWKGGTNFRTEDIKYGSVLLRAFVDTLSSGGWVPKRRWSSFYDSETAYKYSFLTLINETSSKRALLWYHQKRNKYGLLELDCKKRSVKKKKSRLLVVLYFIYDSNTPRSLCNIDPKGLFYK